MKFIKVSGKEKKSVLNITKCSDGSFIFAVSTYEDGASSSEAILIPSDVKIIGDDFTLGG